MVYIKKIFGRAGTGKTYTLTREIESLLNEGVSIRDIAMVTHTRIGVHVFKGRMINELNLNSNDLIHFGTMHSLSWRRQGLRSDDIFGKPQEQDFLETYYPDLIKVPDEYPPEEFYLDSTDKARLSGRSKIKAMIEVDGTLSGCMIKDFDFERMRQMTGRTLGYTSYYVRDASRWSDKHDKRVLDWGRQYEDISPEEQEEFSTNFREYLVQNDLFSHARNLEEMYATKSYIPARYLFFDEFQDFSRLQYEIYLNWAAAPGVEQVTMAGDDSQCFVKGTLVDTPDGQVPIEDIHTGDRISTFAGGSIITDSIVTGAMKRTHFGEVLLIKTKSGRSIKVTPEHHIFVHIPGRTDTDTKGDHYYIYLMYSSKYGYRIGTTNHLKRRLNLEHADSIVGIKRCGTLEEVLYYENLLSLSYCIPKIVFTPRDYTKEQRLQAEMWTDKLFRAIPTVDNAKRLCKDVGIDINFPHAYSQAVIRADTARVVINVQLYATVQKDYKYPRNVLFVETSDVDTINKLKSFGYKLTNAKVGKRLRISSDSVGTIMEECNKLYDILKCPVKIYSNISRHYPSDSEFSKQVRTSLLIPASNILQGMYLSTFDGEKVFLDEVVSVEKEWAMPEVYDLNVDKTHNYLRTEFVYITASSAFLPHLHNI